MKKKSIIKKEDLEYHINWGIKGLQISLVLLFIIAVILMFIAFIVTQNLTDTSRIAFKLPQQGDYMGISIGFLIFIVIPFVLGIEVGINKKR